MKCKHSESNCVVRIINLAWEEMRGCEQGVFCSYNKRKKVLKA